MLRGHLDAITSSGLLEGWAVDDAAPTEPLELIVECDDGSCAAQGYAQLYRADLSAASLGTGWCAFSFRCLLSVSRLSRSTVLLLDAKSRTELHRLVRPAIREGYEPGHRAVAEVLANDPTVITSLSQLDSCGPTFDQFIRARGIETFVRAAYVYVLGRSADEVGIGLYSRLLRKKSLTPHALLLALAESDEFKSRTRLLAAPPTPGFPFRS